MPWLAGIAMLASAAGWLVGPLPGGSFRPDLRALVAYALAVALGYLFIGTLASVWPPSAGGGPDPEALATRMAGQILYGLLFLPFWAGAVAPLALVWIVAVRVLRRRAGIAPAGRSAEDVSDAVTTAHRISSRRLGLFAAALISAYGLFVAVLPLVLYHDPRPPWWFYRPVALFVLFSVPAVIAGIGAVWSRRSLLATAGAICLVQAYVAFSGVTIGFVIPAILLMVLGGSERWPRKTHETRTTLVASIVLIALTIGAWAATLGLTEEVCWSSARTPDGSLIYERIPVTDVITLAPGQVAGGCDGGTLTFEGMGLGAVLAIGAVGLAGASVWTRRDSVARD